MRIAININSNDATGGHDVFVCDAKIDGNSHAKLRIFWDSWLAELQTVRRWWAAHLAIERKNCL